MKAIQIATKGHVRLRDTQTDQQLPHEWDDYTMHTEMLMAKYCHFLNQHNILDGEEGDAKDWGLRGEPIHLYRNYRNYADKLWFQKDLEKLWIEMTNRSFAFGGRGGQGQN